MTDPREDAHRLLDDSGEMVSGAGPVPTEEELVDQPYAAPGRPAQLPIGITYSAYWKAEADGMAKHAREQVKALAMSGLPLRLQSFGQQVVLNEDLAPSVADIAYLEGVSFTRTAIAIKQLVFNTPEGLREAICPSGVRQSNPAAVKRISESTIIYTSWERDRVHPEYIELLKDIGQLWVPCLANFDAFVSSGMPPEKVRVIPYTYSPADHKVAAPRGSDKVPSGKRFYSIAKWEPRKNQHQLLGAFLIGFTPKSKASLLIKTSGFGYGWANYPEFGESLAFWLRDPRVVAQGWTEAAVDRFVRVIDTKISSADMAKLHATNNIYVSAGLGEAWDIPAFEAKLAGNRLVHIGYGATREYAGDGDVEVFWDQMGPVHSGYLWEPEAQWAKYSTEALSRAMQAAAPPVERLVPPGYCRRFSHHAVSRIMEQNILELAGELGCEDEVFRTGGFG